jgi:hypothetical protein
LVAGVPIADCRIAELPIAWSQVAELFCSLAHKGNCAIVGQPGNLATGNLATWQPGNPATK